jgi:transposase InsO family protein
MKDGSPFSVNILALPLYLRFTHAISYRRLAQLFLRADHADLRRDGRRHGSRRRIERLMREMGLSACQGRRQVPSTTDSRQELPIAPNLLARTFSTERPDQVWLADFLSSDR